MAPRLPRSRHRCPPCPCVTAATLHCHPTPPLPQDTRWHELFVQMVQQHAADAAAASAAAPAPDPFAKLGRAPNRPADLPVY